MNHSENAFRRSPELLSHTDSKLLIIDVQEKLLPLIPAAEEMIENCRRLITAANTLNVPVSATEQYPTGLGVTDARLRDLLGDVPEKLRFSCAEVLNWPGAADAQDDRPKIVVAGIEAHVCVQQTVLDLLSQGYQVYIPADAIASRKKFDWKIALERMTISGATLTTTEAVLFEWCEVAGTEEFKAISRLITGKA